MKSEDKLNLVKLGLYLLVIVICATSFSSNYALMQEIVQRGDVKTSNFDNVITLTPNNDWIMTKTAFETYNAMFMQNVIYLNIIFMVLIFMSQNIYTLRDLIKKNE